MDSFALAGREKNVSANIISIRTERDKDEIYMHIYFLSYELLEWITDQARNNEFSLLNNKSIPYARLMGNN